MHVKEKTKQIQQKFENEKLEKNQETCCNGVMGFFENVRTLFDPDEDENCKYYSLVYIHFQI